MVRLVFFLALFGAVVYATFWLIERRSNGGGGRPGGGPGGRPGGRPTPRGPVGPDDDDEFLRELDRKQRHSKDEDL